MLIPQLFYSPRGTPLSAYHRIKDLRRLGHEVEVLTYGPGDPPPDLPGVPIHRARGPHFSSSVKQGPSYLKIWFDALLFLSLLVRLARTRYDVLYAHEEGGFLGALVTRLFRVPLVYDMHSSLPLQIRDWGFSQREGVVSLFRFVERFTVRRAAVTVAISPGVAKAARDAWPAARVVTIVNRFSVEARASAESAARVRAELGIGAGEKLVLYTGSFVALQALDLLVEAIPRVAREAPEARFVLVGGRPHEIAELEALAARVDAAPHVRFLPHRPQAEMPSFLAAADVLVSPRKQGINPPGKLFEYLGSGRPVVATDCPIHDQILDARCAILVAPTAEGLAHGIVSALRDAALAERVVRGAEQVLRDEYGPERREAAYAELVAGIAAARGRE
jgi:glycosyltransferase involved in cell wall biosynthesis